MRLRASSLDWSIYDYIASLQWGNVSDPVLYLHAMFSLPFQISFHFWTNIGLVSSMFQLVHETDHRNPKLYRGICFPQRRYLLNLFDGVCFEKKPSQAQPACVAAGAIFPCLVMPSKVLCLVVTNRGESGKWHSHLGLCSDCNGCSSWWSLYKNSGHGKFSQSRCLAVGEQARHLAL